MKNQLDQSIDFFFFYFTSEDCAPDGKWIILENTSLEQDVDVSSWVLRRNARGFPEITYTIPLNLVMRHGSDLKIFARSAPDAQHRPPYQVINDQLDSWGMSTECETKLFNDSGVERAVHTQKIVFGSETTRNAP